MKKRTVLLLAALLAAADQGIKIWLTGIEMPLIPGVIGLSPVENRGFALGLLPGSALPALIVSAAVLCLLLAFFFKARVTGLSAVAYAMVLGGALGNLIDRVFLGYVRDMFELLFVRFSVFNFADVCVTVGAVLLACGLIFKGEEWNKA